MNVRVLGIIIQKVKEIAESNILKRLWISVGNSSRRRIQSGDETSTIVVEVGLPHTKRLSNFSP